MSAVTAPRTRPARPAPNPMRRRRHLRVVEDVPRRHPTLFMLLYLLTGVGIVLGAVSLNALAAGDAIEARELTLRKAQAERDYGLLTAEVARLESPERIRRAAERMGMVPMDKPRFLEPGRGLPADLAVPVEEAPEDPLKPLLSVGD